MKYSKLISYMESLGFSNEVTNSFFLGTMSAYSSTCKQMIGIKVAGGGGRGGGVLRTFHGHHIKVVILLHEKFLQFDWLRAVVFQLHLKYLHVKITNLLPVVV